MMAEQNTLDKINSWASDKYSSAAPSLTSSMSGTSTPATAPASAGDTGLLAAATPAASSASASSTTSAAPAAPAASMTTPAAAAAPASAPAAAAPVTAGMPAAPASTSTASAAPSSAAKAANVSDWYRAVLGRDGDAAGISYWQDAVNKSGDVNGAYNDFVKSATANNEAVKSGTTLSQANTYAGPQSSDQSTVVDDWGRNVLGRNLSGAEQAKWSAAYNAAKTPADAQAVYQQFLTSMGGSVKNNLDLAGASQISGPIANAQYQPVTIDSSQLSHRTIDKPTETVQGQLGTILAADNPVLQQARAEGQRTAFDRGLGNSSIAASAGEDALIRAATGIATTDSGYYNNASNYNAAAENQALMYNAQAQNAYQSQTQQIEAQAGQQDKSLAAQATLQAQQLASQQTLQAQQLGQQMTLAQIQDATTRWNTEQQTANSRYNTDTSYKQSVDNQKLGVANNIIQNADLSPDRKAAMLEQLGFGTMAKDGVPGTGLAGAVYVLDSTSSDLNFGANRAQQAVNGVMSAIG